MMRVGPTFVPIGTPWDHRGKSEIVQIFISCSQTRINFMYFTYVEEGRYVMSEKFGSEEGSISLKTITFDYPSEYITRISGRFRFRDRYMVAIGNYAGSTYVLNSITFHTNKGTYGPYVPSRCDNNNGTTLEFDYEIGGKFDGFYGTYTSDSIESFGFYMKPLQRLGNRYVFEDICLFDPRCS